MEIIKDRYYKLEQLYDNIETAFGDVGDSLVEDTSITHIIEVVAEIIGDTNNWIEWYIEKDWGKESRLTVIDEYGDEIPSDTLEDLWNLIQSDKGE